MEHLINQKCTVDISIKDVYGRLDIEIPKDYEFTGEFRPWKLTDEAFLNGQHFVEEVSTIGPSHKPRLILRKVKRKQIVFTEVRRNSQPDTRGEYFTVNGADDIIHFWGSNADRVSTTLCTIYKREDKEI